MKTPQTDATARAAVRTAQEAPAELSGVLMVVSFILVLSIVGFVVT